MRDEGRTGRPVKVAKILDDVLANLGLKERMVERELLHAWPEVVGEKIACHSRAVDIKDGILTLRADHAVWRQELTLLMPGIISRYNEIFGSGTVQEVRWDHRVPRGQTHDNCR
jgi:predicted nucleic acid-binding Zn ribbon protein